MNHPESSPESFLAKLARMSTRRSSKPAETDAPSFLLTSPTRQLTLDEAAPRPARPANIAVRRPPPASTTRIHSALPSVAAP